MRFGRISIPQEHVGASQLITAIKRSIVRAARVADLDLRSMRSRLSGLAARHADISAISSVDDEPGAPTDRLLDLASAIPGAARAQKLDALSDRHPPDWVFRWPGEHYKLLCSVVSVLSAERIVEIGTYTGLSALSLLATAGPSARLTTFDIVPWQAFKTTFLRPSDFLDGRLVQVVGDLANRDVALTHASLLREADLIFVDGPKDGVFEERLIKNLEYLNLASQPLVVFDDIRTWNMLVTWRRIARPKLDITSFGHWTGTGFVDWTEQRVS